MKAFPISLLLLLPIWAMSADIKVIDLNHVTVDGIPKGTVVDAIANVPEARAAVLDWLIKQESDRSKAHTSKLAELDKAKADAETKAAFALEKIKAKKAKEEATGKGKRWESLDELEGELNVTATDIRKAEIQARIDAAKEELKNLR